MQMEAEKTVLCAASAYEEKFYLNEKFSTLPENIQDELKIMTVLYTNDVGGILVLEYDQDGTLCFRYPWGSGFLQPCTAKCFRCYQKSDQCDFWGKPAQQ